MISGYSTKGSHYTFICPRKNKTSQSMGHSSIRATPTGNTQNNYLQPGMHFLPLLEEGQDSDFVIYVDGWTQNAVVVLKVMDHDTVIECSHTISPPGQYLTEATGGMLTSSDSDDLVAIVCGGTGGEEANLNLPVKNCWTLTEKFAEPSDAGKFSTSADGLLNSDRIGSASLVIDNGSSLWVTGGLIGEWGRNDSEIVTVSKNTIPFSTNAAGPHIRSVGCYHCIQAIGTSTIVVTGGIYDLSRNGIKNMPSVPVYFFYIFTIYNS